MVHVNRDCPTWKEVDIVLESSRIPLLESELVIIVCCAVCYGQTESRRSKAGEFCCGLDGVVSVHREG